MPSCTRADAGQSRLGVQGVATGTGGLSPAAVRRFFDRWYGWAIRSRLAPVTRVARTIKRHPDGVLRYVRHPITKGVAEGLNSKIMSIKRMAGGFRNLDHFTIAIYLHCGGLDLCPR